jgi:hypothetical protein
MISPVEVAAIHFAMSKAEGKRLVAAEQLGLTSEELDAKIRESSDLTTLWGRSAPVEVDPFDRERPNLSITDPVDLSGLPEGVTPRDAQVANAFEGLGVTDPKAVTLMKQFQQGVGRGIIQMLDAMCGGMGFCFAQVSARFAFAAERLAELEKKAAASPLAGEDLNNYAFWHAQFVALAREMKGFNKEATNAAHTRLLIADRARKMQGAGKDMKKPGWRKVSATGIKTEGAHG